MRRTVSAGALALAALFAAGCGPGQDPARVATSPPAEFVDAVRQLVRPAERMGVVSASAADATGEGLAELRLELRLESAVRASKMPWPTSVTTSMAHPMIV